MLECPPRKKWVPNTAMTLAPNDKGKATKISLKRWGTPIPGNHFRKLKVKNYFFSYSWRRGSVEVKRSNLGHEIAFSTSKRNFTSYGLSPPRENKRQTGPCRAQGQCRPAKKVSEQRKSERTKNGGKREGDRE